MSQRAHLSYFNRILQTITTAAARCEVEGGGAGRSFTQCHLLARLLVTADTAIRGETLSGSIILQQHSKFANRAQQW